MTDFLFNTTISLDISYYFKLSRENDKKIYENAVWFVDVDSRKTFTEYCRNLKGAQMIQ